MGDGVNIDTLEIEVEASSEGAVEKINALTESLRKLQEQTKQKFGNIVKQIESIGSSASLAQKNVYGKKEALDRATGRSKEPKYVKSHALPNMEKETSKAASSLHALESIKLHLREQLRGTELQAIKTDGAIEELNRAVKGLRDLGPFQNGTELKLKATESAITDLTLTFEKAGDAAKELAQISSEISDVKFDLSAPGTFREIDAYVERATEGIQHYKDTVAGVESAIAKANNALASSKASVGIEKTLAEGEAAKVKAIREAAANKVKEKIKIPIPKIPKIKSPDMSALKKDIQYLNKQKLNLTNELAKADIQAVKTDGKLADMRRNLEDFREKAGMDQSALASIKEAEDRIGKFASSTQEANEYLGDMHKALSILKDYKFDPSTAAGQAEIKETARELRNATQRYKELTDAEKLAGEVAKNAMAEAKAAVGGVKKPGKTGKGQAGVPGVTGQEAEIIEPSESLLEKLGLLERIKSVAKSIASKSFGKSLGSAGGSDAVSASNALSRFKEIKNEIGKLDFGPVKKLGDAFKNLSNSVLGAAKNLGKFALSLPGKAFSGIINGTKTIGKRIIGNITKPFAGAIEKVSRWKKMLGSALFYSTVFRGMTIISNGIKEGIENLYNYSKLIGTEFAPAMNSLATSALYLKNSLGAMAAPLIQALAPAIDFIIDKFVALLNVIGKVFAALTGKSVYTQAKKHAVEYGEAAKDASKATKDFLLGIDELNVLNDKDSGAGGAASDFGDMFEEVEIPNDIKDWTDKIREAIEKGDWRGAGSILADKLNEIVENWDAYGWGQKLGEKINNALNFAYGFLTTFEFETLGRKVADFFNGIFDTVDWDLLGRTFAAGWNGLMEFIYGLIDGFNWDVFGKAIADAIIGFFSEIDWELPIKILKAGIDAIRDALVGFLNEFGERLDLHGITDPLVEIVNTVADTVQKVIDLTVEWAKSLDFTPLITSFELLLAAISPFVSLLSEGLLWGYENVLLPLATWTIEEAVPAAVDVLTAAFELLTAAIERLSPIVKGFIETVVPIAKQVIIDALNGIRDVFEKLTSLIRGDTTFKEFFDSLSAGEKIAIALGIAIGGITLALAIAGTAVSVFSGIAQSAHTIVTALKLAIEGASLVLSLITSPVGIAVAAITGLIAVVALCAAHFESFREVVVQVWEGIKTTLSEVASWFMTYVVTPIVDGWNNFIKPVIDSLVERLGDAITNHIVPLLKTVMQVIGKVAEVIGFVFEKIIGPLVKWVISVAAPVVGAAIGFIGDVFITLANTIADASTGILEVFSGVIDFVAGVFTGDWERAWNGVKEIFAGVWDTMVSVVEGAVNLIIDGINLLIRGLNAVSFDVPDWLGGGHFGFNIQEIQHKQFGRLGDSYKSSGSYSNNRNYDRNNGKIMYGETGSEFRERVNSGSYNSDLLSGIKDMTKMSDSITDLMNGLKSATQAQTESNVGVSESISELLSKIENTDYQTPPQSSLYTPGMASPLASPMGTLPNSYNSNSQGSGSSYDGAAIINAINAQGDRIVDAINSQDYGTYLDGKTLMQSVERAQRQRGANIMGGGVLV